MKKLIMAVAVICCAAFTQAATVSWASGKLFAPGENGGFSTTAVKSGANAYLFLISNTQYDTFNAAFTSTGNMNAVWEAFGNQLADADKSGKTISTTSTSTLKSTADVGDTVYGAIIYTVGTGDDMMYIANIATGTVGSDAGLTISGLGTTFLGTAGNGGSTGGWKTQAVPEPTSGLLLLLGMAGLALRRKQA